MVKNDFLARYLEPLLRGDRKACRTVIEEDVDLRDEVVPVGGAVAAPVQGVTSGISTLEV